MKQQQSCREEIQQRLESIPEQHFIAHGWTLEKILHSESAMDDLQTIYQKSMKDLGYEPEEAFWEAMACILGIPQPVTD